MSSVSRARRGAISRDGPSASAASSSRRLVSDFEPGSDTVAADRPVRARRRPGLHGPSLPHPRASEEVGNVGSMCGRYVSVQADADLTDEFDAVDATNGEWPEPDWNVAPTKPVRIVVNRPLRDADGKAAPRPPRGSCGSRRGA